MTTTLLLVGMLTAGKFSPLVSAGFDSLATCEQYRQLQVIKESYRGYTLLCVTLDEPLCNTLKKKEKRK